MPINRNPLIVVGRKPRDAWRRRLSAVLQCGLLAILLIVAPMAAEESKTGDGGAPLTTKALSCVTNNNYCEGSFNELIRWIKTYKDGSVKLQLRTEIPDSLASSLACAFAGGARVDVSPKTDGDDGEESILNQLYISAALNTKIRLKFVEGTDGLCKLDHIFAYFEPA